MGMPKVSERRNMGRFSGTETGRKHRCPPSAQAFLSDLSPSKPFFLGISDPGAGALVLYGPSTGLGNCYLA